VRDAIDLGKDHARRSARASGCTRRSTFQSGSLISRIGFPCTGAVQV
jgi:hypothetical protein